MSDSGVFLTWEEWKESNPLKVHMKNRGLPQAHLASQMDVSTNAIQRWLLGINAPCPKNIEEMARVLGVPAEELDEQFKAWRAAKP